MTLTEFIAEIESDLSNYSKDIDKSAIKFNILQQLKIFGTNITIVKEKVLDVKNSKTKLPEDFKSLKLALKLKPLGHCFHGKKEDLEGSYIYRQRIENPTYFDEVNQEYVKSCCEKIVTETIKLGDKDLHFYYDREWLTLIDGIQKDTIDSNCLNLHPSIRGAYPHEISITGNYINTNFSEGSIYIQYNALPTGEDGEIEIPEFTTGDIFRYLEQYIKVKIAEDLIINNKNPMGIAQIYPMWKAEMPRLKAAALTEAKFSKLPKDWGKRFKALNQRDFAVFNLQNLNFNARNKLYI